MLVRGAFSCGVRNILSLQTDGAARLCLLADLSSGCWPHYQLPQADQGGQRNRGEREGYRGTVTKAHGTSYTIHTGIDYNHSRR